VAGVPRAAPIWVRLMPITLAVLLSFVLAPAVRGLQRRRLPRSLAVLVGLE
jgi:predicted PurR-regulated permease PerM